MGASAHESAGRPRGSDPGPGAAPVRRCQRVRAGHGAVPGLADRSAPRHPRRRGITAPCTYGPPFPTPPTRGSGGFPWWWFILAAIVIGPVAIGAGVAVFGSNMFSSSSPLLERLGRPTEHRRCRRNPHQRTIQSTDRPRRQDSYAEAPHRPWPSIRRWTSCLRGQRQRQRIGENKTIACNDSIRQRQRHRQHRRDHGALHRASPSSRHGQRDHRGQRRIHRCLRLRQPGSPSNRAHRRSTSPAQATSSNRADVDDTRFGAPGSATTTAGGGSPTVLHAIGEVRATDGSRPPRPRLHSRDENGSAPCQLDIR